MMEVLAILILMGILVYRRLSLWQDFNNALVGGKPSLVVRKPSKKAGSKGQKGYVSFHSRDTKKRQKPRKIAAGPALKAPWGW
jgi:hypothetical protein